MELDDKNVCKLLDLSEADLSQTRKNFLAKEKAEKSQKNSKPNCETVEELVKA